MIDKKKSKQNCFDEVKRDHRPHKYETRVMFDLESYRLTLMMTT